jgi:hypothetical protein
MNPISEEAVYFSVIGVVMGEEYKFFVFKKIGNHAA